ncbi:carboxypeptidase-like regulatory domain-containing protein [Calycomorphotria hydatis]|uniref:Carboxypeptidase regulatory-like domain-containing protein n=1 Tax=Calycomorphotria hydatis TaxID=2528027 RepID=A0A517TE90_9PLAN|nr:carboxypeptidase-like regulatory domain-containing protein [Calycomorphotria hydatis]QDT66683.1 hypothetical protein V22_39540 [Calycomorphotria hydatis]
MLIKMNFTWAIMWFMFPIMVATGCGQKLTKLPLVPVNGTVTMDGQPLANAEVEFSPIEVEMIDGYLGGSGANGPTNNKGFYHMHLGSSRGVQPGRYLVRIHQIATDEQSGNDIEMVPAKYNSKSEIEVTITEDGNKDLNFELSSK